MRTNCLFVFCICSILHVTYGQTQVVLVSEFTNSVSLFEATSNFTTIWDSNTEINEFILSSSSYSIQISKNNQKINIETNRINFPSFSLETENCVIIIDGYNELLDILQNNQQIISKNTEEITIQDKTFQLFVFETTNLTIGFEVNKMNKKSIVAKDDPDCCNIIGGDITISENCICLNPMTIDVNSVTFSPSVVLKAPEIVINSVENFLVSDNVNFQANILLVKSKGEITIDEDASFSVAEIAMNGTRVMSNNIYSSDVTTLTLVGYLNGIYFCGNIDSSATLNLLGTSNSNTFAGVEICNAVPIMEVTNLLIKGLSATKEGVKIQKSFSCSENSCDITGESIENYGVYLSTPEISNVKNKRNIRTINWSLF